MNCWFSVLCVLLALAVAAFALPSEIPNNEVCAEGESLSEAGVCEPVLLANPQPTPKVKKAPKKIKSTKKKAIKKKLNEEISEIKRIALEGLDRGDVVLTCPDGKELNAHGVCDDEPDTQLQTKPKTKKQLALEKKLEKELELVMKKAIQNDLKRRRRLQKKKDKEEAEKREKESLPLCGEGAPADATDCRPSA